MQLIQNGSNGPNDDAIAELLRQYRTQKRKCEEENGVLRSIIKRAKTEGLNTKALTGAVAATKLDPDVVIGNLRDEIHYMNILRIEVSQDALYAGWQIDLQPATESATDAFDAEDQGYKAGRAGVSLDDCPYPPGSPHIEAYTTHWHKGQAAIARELGDNVIQASRKRGRPKRVPDNGSHLKAVPVKETMARKRKSNGNAHADL